jgi:hypothetical protein
MTPSQSSAVRRAPAALHRTLELTGAQAARAAGAPDAYRATHAELNRHLREEVDPEFYPKWDVAPSPFVLAAEEVDAVFAAALALHDAIEVAVDLWAGGDPALRTLFARYEGLRHLVTKPGPTWQGWGRYDFLIAEDGRPVFIETNAAMASGCLPNHFVMQRYADTAPDVLRPVGTRHELPYDRLETPGSRVLALEEAAGGPPGALAVLVDENSKWHESGMLVQSLRAAGAEDIVLGDVGEVVERMGRLWLGGRPLATTFNKFRLFGAKHHWSDRSFRYNLPFLEALSRRLALPINCLAAQTVAEDKAIFAALRMPHVLAAIGPEGRAVVEAHTMPSFAVEPGPVELDGVRRDLRDALLLDREGWVLKPRNDYRGSGVIVGRGMDATAWRDAVDAAAAGSGTYLAQRRVETAALPVAIDDGATVAVEGLRLAGGVYLVARQPIGFVARAGRAEVVNAITGARILPVWAVERAAPQS